MRPPPEVWTTSLGQFVRPQLLFNGPGAQKRPPEAEHEKMTKIGRTNLFEALDVCER